MSDFELLVTAVASIEADWTRQDAPSLELSSLSCYSAGERRLRRQDTDR